jgi:hypothetical protein
VDDGDKSGKASQSGRVRPRRGLTFVFCALQPNDDAMSTEKSAATEDATTLYWRMVRAFDFLRALHQTFSDQVKTADQKAGYILTFLTILFAYSREQGHVLLFLRDPPSWSFGWVLSLVFAAAAGFSIVCTLMVFLPRKVAGGKPSFFFWGTWAKDSFELERLLRPDLDEFVLTQYVRDVQNLSRICRAKYKFVNLAFRGTAATILCFVVLILLR